MVLIQADTGGEGDCRTACRAAGEPRGRGLSAAVNVAARGGLRSVVAAAEWKVDAVASAVATVSRLSPPAQVPHTQQCRELAARFTLKS